MGQEPVLLGDPSVFPLVHEGVESLPRCSSSSPALVGLAELCAGNAGLDVRTGHWEESQVEESQVLAAALINYTITFTEN